jgi:hypothetical protein
MKMLEKLAPVIEKIGTYLWAIAFLAGVVFIFFGFFDLRDLRSIELRAGGSWGPIVTGGLLAAIGLALHLLWPPRPERDPSSQLSGGLLYVLRHLDARGDYRFPYFYAYQLYVFNTKSPSDPEFEASRSAWAKASDYAVRCLALNGFAEQCGPEYRITAEGRKALQSDSLRAKYTDAFSRPLVTKDD